MMRLDAFRLRRKAKGNGQIKFFKSQHHLIEPPLCIGAQPVGPAQPRSKPLYTQLPQPGYGRFQPVVFKMEPLANAELRCKIRKVLQRQFGRAVFAQQP
jgi:hypothetical protein